MIECYTTAAPLTFRRFMGEQVRTGEFWSAVFGFIVLVGAVIVAMLAPVQN